MGNLAYLLGEFYYQFPASIKEEILQILYLEAEIVKVCKRRSCAKILVIERVSIDRRKIKSKVITLANQKGRRQSSKPIKTLSNYT